MVPRYSRTGLALAATPLYGGPVLGGWSGAGVALVLVLAAIFFLMQIMSGKEATRGQMSRPAFFVMLGGAQLLVVTLAFGLGAGLAQVTGPLAIPIWVPLALTGVGAVIWGLRYRHRPEEGEMNALLDQAIATIETGTASMPAPEEGPVEIALRDLAALPSSPQASRIDPIVQALETATGSDGFALLLKHAQDTGDARVLRAVLRYVASPRIRAELVATGALGDAMPTLLQTDDPGALFELAGLIGNLLDENAPATALPDPDIVAERVPLCPALGDLVTPLRQAVA